MLGTSFTASSTFRFSGTTAPLRQPPSAVISTLAPASFIRPRRPVPLRVAPRLAGERPVLLQALHVRPRGERRGGREDPALGEHGVDLGGGLLGRLGGIRHGGTSSCDARSGRSREAASLVQ